MSRLDFIVETLEKEMHKLKNDNDRLVIQINACDDMINGYNKRLYENDRKIIAIKNVIQKL